jgi:hypothetical protein
MSGLEADFQPVCHYDNIPMENTCIKILHFPLNEPEYWEKGKWNGYALDVECECPQCGYWETFGVAVDPKHWATVYKQYEEDENEQKLQYGW